MCEFALIVATLGVTLGALPATMLHVAAGVVLVTMAVNPVMQRGAEAAIRLFDRLLPESWVYRLRLLLAKVITSFGLAGVAALTLLLSSAVLPRWPVVAVCAAFLVFLMWRGWYALGRFYTEWQLQLRSLDVE